MNIQNTIDAERPWPGLLPFTEDAKAFFHGRETETNELTRLIEREPLTVLFGQSGLGKSSLLNAGVFPRLRRAGYLPLYLRLNLDANAPALIDQVWQVLKDECARHEVSATQPRAGDSFWKYLHRPDTLLQNPHGRPVTPVLAFDQFEELFTLGRQTPQQNLRCQVFLRELGELIENRLPPSLEDELTNHPEALDGFDLLRQNLKIVFAFREDYLAEFEGLKTLIRPIMQNRMRLTPMTGGHAALAIKQAGADKVSETVAARIVRFVGGAGRDETIRLENVSVEPALLSLVCRELNEQRLTRREAEISADLIQGDNTQQIIEQFYRQGFAGVDAKVKHFVEDRLLTTAGYRDSCALDNALAEPSINEEALQTLVDRRILRREERGGLVRLELIHDVLAGVAKTSRDQRRTEAALTAAKQQIAKQKKRQRFFAMAAAALVAVFAGISWLAVDANRARAVAEEQRVAAVAATKNAEMARKGADAQRVLAEAAGARASREEQNAVDQKLAAESALARAQIAERRALQEKSAAEFSRADGERTLGLALAEKADRAFTDGRTNDGQIYAAHALARLETQQGARAATVAASMRGQRIAFPGVANATLAGSGGLMSAFVFSRDGQLFATASLDNVVRIWNATSNALIAKLNGHAQQVNGIIFSPDGRTLASASNDRSVRLWNVADGTLRHILNGHEAAASGVIFSEDGRNIVSWSADKSARLWNVETGMPAAVLKGHEQSVTGAAFSPDGKRVVSWSWQKNDASLRLWDAESGRAITTITGHENYILSVSFSPDGRLIASASADKTVRLWSAVDGTLISVLKTPTMLEVYKAVFSPDGRVLATGSWDQAVRLWNIETRAVTRTLRGHSAMPQSVEFSKDGRTLTSFSVTDTTVRQWDVTSGNSLSIRKAIAVRNALGQLSPNGSTLVSTSAQGEGARLWSATESPATTTYLSATIGVIAFSKAGRGLVFAAVDDTVQMWDVRGGSEIATYRGHAAQPTAADLSPDGRTLATGSQDKIVRLWEAASGKLITAFAGHSDAINDVRFSPDGRTLASGSVDKTIRIWDIASGAHVATLEGHAAPIMRIAFSPDGRRLASSSTDETVRLWDMPTKTYVASFIGHHDRVTDVAFSPDGLTLASASLDKTVRLWNVADQTTRVTLSGHTGPVLAITYSPSGRMLMSGSFDKTARIWDIATSKAAKIIGTSTPLSRLAFSPDESTLMAASTTGLVHVWRDFKRENSITNWQEQAAKDEARYSLKLDGIALVPK